MAFHYVTQRMLGIFILAVLISNVLIFAFRAGSVTALIHAIKDDESAAIKDDEPTAITDDESTPITEDESTANHDNHPAPAYGLGDILFELYKPIKLPVTAESYTDQLGSKFDNGHRNYWKEPMGKEILIVDIDTRNPDGKNGIFNANKIHWEAVEASGSGLLTVSHLNHFIYSQIHGYDYKFFHARKMKGHWDTWIKPHVLQKMIQDYKFVVFIDADAIIQHLEVPMEFLFNRWNISPNTSIAMPIDTRQRPRGKDNHSTDSKGKVVLNSGVVILQNLPYTHDMMQAWTSCTTEERYPGCGHWKDHWSHEQRAFSEYIRYDFNPQGNNIIEIPCNDATGYPGLFGKAAVVDNCKGEFIRHYTLEKTLTKTSASDVLMQSIAELLQRNFAENHKYILVEENR
ncbi:hypothetical protein BR93DRAFT_81816 [Coniochaeta sp. PMI_546]|nr:hypothetical protein BR93DRAFT_81816 [Coniochaeta sp. PMI_546]